MPWSNVKVFVKPAALHDPSQSGGRERGWWETSSLKLLFTNPYLEVLG